MVRIIAIANQKGGVGKTTTTANLGVCLSEIDAVINRSVRFEEAPGVGEPTVLRHRRFVGAQAYRQLAEALLQEVIV